MTTKNIKDEIITVRVSARILQRARNVLDGQRISEFVRLAMLREIERQERRGANG